MVVTWNATENGLHGWSAKCGGGAGMEWAQEGAEGGSEHAYEELARPRPLKRAVASSTSSASADEMRESFCVWNPSDLYVRRPLLLCLCVDPKSSRWLYICCSNSYPGRIATSLQQREGAPDGHTSAGNGKEGKRDYYYLSFLLEETITNDSLALLC